ncbi:hypothetical protein KI387_010825 [Taxus chinensis]|uniref:Uncharacterized protein n=1 Tax=Taxus chinensis TaxID=29808 RepID=A0AA38FLX9_TAXCH|nr:hypothetical protein KI387_010825 [Taxus chinensis]
MTLVRSFSTILDLERLLTAVGFLADECYRSCSWLDHHLPYEWGTKDYFSYCQGACETVVVEKKGLVFWTCQVACSTPWAFDGLNAIFVALPNWHYEIEVNYAKDDELAPLLEDPYAAYSKDNKKTADLRSLDARLAPRLSKFTYFNLNLYRGGLELGSIKLASVQLARKYMKRVASELDNSMNVPEKEPMREFILLQGVRFAFRVHQFAGGFDEESMRAFEELRGRAHAQAEGTDRSSSTN